MPKSLHGKIVLITGASSGFGADAARLFAKEGCRVILSARRMERMQAVAEEIIAAGGDATIIQMDITETSQIDEVVHTVIDNYGRIDILFNNAGYGRLDWLENQDIARDINTQIAANLTGLIQVTRIVLPYMIHQRSGHIINMSSVAGWIAPPLYSIYAATKYGVRGFTEALRREVRHLGIRVSGIYPGGAATEFGQHTGNPTAKLSLKLPKWIHMTSEYVARKVVSIAKHPRPTVIVQWWMILVIFLTRHFPRTTDWVLVQVAKRTHKV